MLSFKAIGFMFIKTSEIHLLSNDKNWNQMLSLYSLKYESEYLTHVLGIRIYVYIVFTLESVLLHKIPV